MSRPDLRIALVAIAMAAWGATIVAQTNYVATPVASKTGIQMTALHVESGAIFASALDLPNFSSGDIYAGSVSGGSLARLTAVGGPLVSPGSIIPGDGSFAGSNEILVCDWNAFGSAGGIFRVDRVTGAVNLVNTTPGGDPFGIAVGPGGAYGTDLYVQDFEGVSSLYPHLDRMNPGGQFSAFASDPVQWTTVDSPAWLQFDPTGSYGGLLFVGGGGGGGGPAKIWSVDAAGTIVSVFQDLTGHYLGGFVFPPNGPFAGQMMATLVSSSETLLVSISPSGSATPMAILPGSPLGSFLPTAPIACDSGDGSIYVGIGGVVYQVEVSMGQPNSAAARLELNGVATGNALGPFTSPVTRGQNLTLDLSGDPGSLYVLYGSTVLNPAGWNFPGFGYFELGTGPSFSDVFVILDGYTSIFPFYALDGTGHAQLTSYVPPSLATGPYINIQALIQRQPPLVNGIWSSLSAAHTIVIQ